MKKLIVLIGTVAFMAGAFPASADEDQRYQTSNVIDANGVKPYQGAAWLVRTEGEMEGQISSLVDHARRAYTIWLILFNNPDACMTVNEEDGSIGCSADDLGSLAVRACVFNGGGAISADDGSLRWHRGIKRGGVVNISFEFSDDGIPSGQFVLLPDLPGCAEGLDDGNGFGAELHMIIDEHPKVPAGESWISDLTTTNLPGGPATNHRVAVFLPCPDASCPASAL